MTDREFRLRAQRFVFASLGISGATERKWVRLSVEAAPAKDNEVLLYGPMVDDLEADCMNDFTEYDTMVSAQMVRARLNDIEGDVTVRVNTPGGSWFEASSIHAAFVERRNAGDDVHVVIDGLSASGGSLVMLAASSITIAAMGSVMIHKAWERNVGNADAFRKAAGEMDQFDAEQARMLGVRLGKDVDEVMGLLAAETWYTATEAVEAGLADSKIEIKPEPKKKAQTNAARNARFRAMLALEA